MPIPTGWTLRQVVEEFVRDIEAAYDVGAPGLRGEWGDLHVTYELAKQVLAEQDPTANTGNNKEISK